MFHIRPFRNSDPPHLARIWCSQPAQRGLNQPTSPPHLEMAVFSKLHFDRRGLLVAARDGVPMGFVHAGFGPDEQGLTLDKSLGTTLVLMLEGGRREGALAADLLSASEDYLRGEGAEVLYAGGIQPLNGFYLGLYGGSEIPGVLQSDEVFLDAVRQNNYRQIDGVRILWCDMVGFRPLISHQLRTVKRLTEVVEKPDPPPTTWWDACVWGNLQRSIFELRDKSQRQVLARASFWDLQPLATDWSVASVGLFDLQTDPSCRRRGYATYLLGEAIRMLGRRGAARIEAHTMASNEASLAFYAKMGFFEIDSGFVFRKDSSGQT